MMRLRLRSRNEVADCSNSSTTSLVRKRAPNCSSDSRSSDELSISTKINCASHTQAGLLPVASIPPSTVCSSSTQIGNYNKGTYMQMQHVSFHSFSLTCLNKQLLLLIFVSKFHLFDLERKSDISGQFPALIIYICQQHFLFIL